MTANDSKVRFNVTRHWERITGAVALERERLAAGEERQKHLALEYFACFAVDAKDKPLKRAEVEKIFRSMTTQDIELEMNRLRAAINEENIKMASSRPPAPLPADK